MERILIWAWVVVGLGLVGLGVELLVVIGMSNLRADLEPHR